MRSILIGAAMLSAACGEEPGVLVSTGLMGAIRAVDSGDGIFVAQLVESADGPGTKLRVARSPDGLTWTTGPVIDDVAVEDAWLPACAGGSFRAHAAGGTVAIVYGALAAGSWRPGLALSEDGSPTFAAHPFPVEDDARYVGKVSSMVAGGRVFLAYGVAKGGDVRTQVVRTFNIAERRWEEPVTLPISDTTELRCTSMAATSQGPLLAYQTFGTCSANTRSPTAAGAPLVPTESCVRMLRSTDGGQTWASTGTPFLAVDFDLLFASGDVVFAHGVSNALSEESPVLVKTRDFGATWESVFDGPVETVVGDGPRLWALLAGPENTELVSSSDLGATWQQRPVAAPRPILMSARGDRVTWFWPEGSDELRAAVSLDGGVTWGL